MWQQIIERAMDDKSVIEFTYGGHRRIAEPHVIGENKGSLGILCYQIGGSSSSSSGGLPQWRRFDLSGIQNLAAVDAHFPGQRPEYGRHSSWDRTIKIVAP